MELSKGIFAIEFRRVLAEDDMVVVLATVGGTQRQVCNVRGGACLATGERESDRVPRIQGDEQTEDRFWS
jgi:hypothetical protein